jgi:hypothetical protein
VCAEITGRVQSTGIESVGKAASNTVLADNVDSLSSIENMLHPTLLISVE